MMMMMMIYAWHSTVNNKQGMFDYQAINIDVFETSNWCLSIIFILSFLQI